MRKKNTALESRCELRETETSGELKRLLNRKFGGKGSFISDWDRHKILCPSLVTGRNVLLSRVWRLRSTNTTSLGQQRAGGSRGPEPTISNQLSRSRESRWLIRQAQRGKEAGDGYFGHVHWSRLLPFDLSDFQTKGYVTRAPQWHRDRVLADDAIPFVESAREEG